MRLHWGEISRYLFVALMATCASGTSPRAADAPIAASIDEAKRNVRLDPIGASIRVPDNLTVYNFLSRPDFLSISSQLPDMAGMSLDIRFQAVTCGEWFASTDESYQKNTKQPGKELADDRWNPTWLAKEPFRHFCLDRPGAGSVQVRANAPFDEYPQISEPFCQFTANMADALLPGTNRGVAGCLNSAGAQAAQPKSSINVDAVYPRPVYMTLVTCDVEGRLCDHAAKYREIHKACVNGDAGACSAMGMFAQTGDDFKNAATFYQRACELGAGDDACNRAKTNAKKAR